MKFDWPDKIQVGHIDVTIESATSSELHEMLGTHARGAYSPEDYAIYYLESLSSTEKDVIVLHELFHAVEDIIFADHLALPELAINPMAIFLKGVMDKVFYETVESYLQRNRV